VTSLVADLQRAAAALSAVPSDGPCDETCGCLIDGAAPASPAVPVPLVRDRDGGPIDRASADVPIACTLPAGDMSARLDEWKELLAGKQDLLQGVTARRALADGGVRLEFGPGSDVAKIARLAAAEQSCCRFFSFSLVIDTRGIALEVHAPPAGRPVLIALFGVPA
jgi:MerR family transcriptional regulator, copper efflux regulator